jgi:signal transduction histidine kinase
MLDPRPPRPSALDRPATAPPTVTPPPPFAERRVAYRRADDQRMYEERVFLARAMDALAADAPADERLAALLRLLARTAGARRAAVIADGVERRAAVSMAPGEDPAAAEALGAWLDATSDRSRAERAASPPASIAIVATAAGPMALTAPARGGANAAAPRTYARVAVPRSAGVVLGFEFDSPARAARLGERLPDGIARHASVALAIVTAQIAAERAAAMLRARDVERERFVSTVAHELRTPLTGLGGYLELILDGKVEDRDVERDFLARSRSIVASMAELVGDLLELSRLESGTLELEVEPFSVAEAAGHVAASLLPIAIGRDIRLATDLPPRLRSATGDRRRVEQILTNLGGNALKFTPAGGSVEVVAFFDGPVAVLIVRDDGPGIEPADRARIFERFERLLAHDDVAGTGLGLSIARDLAQRMDGDLEVASVVGSGSAFVLVLPGPLPVGGAALAATLERALADEEQRLEDRAVLGALAGEAGGRAGGRGRAFASSPGRQARDHRPGSASAVDG